MPRLLRITRLVLCLALLALVALPARIAWADEQDQSALGSITLEFNNKSELSLNGSEISLYLVGTASYDAEAPHFDTSKGQFAGSSTVAGIPDMTSKQLDDNNRTLAEQLEKEATKAKATPYRSVTVASDKASFAGIEQGLYLVCQTRTTTRGPVMGAFLLSVPDTEGMLDVTADPKPDIEIRANSSNTDKKDDNGGGGGKKDTNTNTNTNTRRKTNTRNGTSSNSVTRRLARTGDPTVQAWPIALAGIGVLLVGLVMRRSKHGGA